MIGGGKPMQTRKVILVAVDLTDSSKRVVEEALETARAFGGEVIIAHVVHELRELFGVYVSEEPVGSLQDSLEREAEKKLADLAGRFLEGAGIPYRTVALCGTPWMEIVRHGKETGADLIVIGPHVSDRPVHTILGSTAERILRHAPCSVLVVSPRGVGVA